MRVADMTRMSAEGENGEKYRNKIVEMLGGLYVPNRSVHSGMHEGRGAYSRTRTVSHVMRMIMRIHHTVNAYIISYAKTFIISYAHE